MAGGLRIGFGAWGLGLARFRNTGLVLGSGLGIKWRVRDLYLEGKVYDSTLVSV